MKIVTVFALLFLVMLSGCGDSNPASPNDPPVASTLSAVVDFSLVQLSWTQCSDDDFAEYRLYRSTSAGISSNPGTPIATFTNVSDLTYNDSSVEQDEDYYYVLQTVDTGDLSTWSNEIHSHTPVEAQAGSWSGTTDQGKPITFFVTTDGELGEVCVELDISLAPDITWTFSDYTAYGLDGTWTRDGEETSGGHTHTITMEGTFDSSNLCTGSFTAASETYYGGYYIEAEFTVYSD